MASQDLWCKPLADELVGVFRVDSLDYIRITTGYDPATGDTTTTETVFSSAGAVLKMANIEEGGIAGPQTLQCWVDLTSIDEIWPTPHDCLQYQGKRWRLTTIDPAYAGDTRYAAKLTARSA